MTDSLPLSFHTWNVKKVSLSDSAPDINLSGASNLKQIHYKWELCSGWMALNSSSLILHGAHFQAELGNQITSLYIGVKYCVFQGVSYIYCRVLSIFPTIFILILEYYRHCPIKNEQTIIGLQDHRSSELVLHHEKFRAIATDKVQNLGNERR